METTKITAKQNAFGYADFEAETVRPAGLTRYRCVEFSPGFLHAFKIDKTAVLDPKIVDKMTEMTQGKFNWQTCFNDTRKHGGAQRFDIVLKEGARRFQMEVFARSDKNLSVILWTAEDGVQGEFGLTDVNFKSFFNHLDIGCAIYEVNNDGETARDYVFKDINKKGIELEQKPKDKIIGRTITAVRPTIKDFGLIPVLREVWKTGETRSLPTQHYQDGRFDNWYENIVFKMPGGEIAALYRDVTAWVKMQQALEESRNELDLYFRKAPTGIIIFDDEGRYINVNEMVCRHTGKTKEEMLAMTIYDRDNGAGDSRFPSMFQELKDKEKIDTIIEAKRRDGASAYFSIRGERLSKTRYICFIMDVTQRRKLEEELRKSGEILRHYFDKAPLCIFVFNHKGEITESNQRASEMLGYSKTALAKKQMFDLVDRAYLKKTQECLETFNRMGAISCEQVFKTSDNKSVVMNINGVKLDVDMFIVFGTDITEEKRLQQRLMDSEEEYRALFDHAGTGIIYVNSNGRIIWFNKIAAKNFGGNPEDFAGKKLDRVFPKETAEKLQDRIRRVIMLNQPAEYEDQIKTFNGFRWEKTVYNCIFDQNRELLGIEIIFQNITDIRLSEKKIAESEQKYRSLFEDAPIGNQALDENGIIIDVNKKWIEMTGYAREAVIGRKFSDFLTPQYAEKFQTDYEAYMKAGHIKERLELIKKNGEVGIFQKTGTVNYDDRHVFQQTHCSLEDVTEIDHAQRKLAESEREYRSIFNQAAFGITSLSPEGYFIEANQKFCDMIGYTNEELKKKTFLQITHPDDRKVSEARFRRFFQDSGPIEDLEKRYIRKDGTELYVGISSTLIADDFGKPKRLIVSSLDLTEQKKIEKEKEQYEAQLRETQRLESVGILAGGVAHEINNPINGIMNYSQLIIDTKENTEAVKEYANEIIKESQRVSDIVRDLLRFSRQEKEPFSDMKVSDIVESTVSLIKTLFRNDNIILIVDVPKNLPVVNCRGQQIQQVLMNLMTNARDALNHKYPGHDPDKCLFIRAQTVETYKFKGIRITVEDHGTGISEDIKSRMFDPFFTTKGRDRGTGLGLSISHRIMMDHSGRLEAESAPGKYTRFYIDLPFKRGG